MQPIQTTIAGVPSVAYHEVGSSSGPPVFLLHGFPYDVHAYEDVAPRLADAGCRVIVPHLRGFGPTRFLDDATPRSGEQAALGADLLALMDALGVQRAVLAGYDWGGRAACVVSALWPQRCAGLVSCNSYNIQDRSQALQPVSPSTEQSLWYQYYFLTERGREGLARNRREFNRLLWQLWTPACAFDDATFARSAPAFDNPDFVDVVIHSYRHRFDLAPGDPAYAAIEAQLAAQPAIAVPAITFDGANDGVRPPAQAAIHANRFSAQRSHRILQGIGHNVPQEAPRIFADAVCELLPWGAR